MIVGPSASGKSDLAVELAKKFDGEIISADSRRVYRGMDIGTSKIAAEEEEIKKNLHDKTSALPNATAMLRGSRSPASSAGSTAPKG